MGARARGFGPKDAQARQLAREEGRHEARRQGHPDDARDASRSREERDRDRPERDPEIAAHGKHAHSGRAALAGRVVRVARALGVEGGDARARKEDRGDRRAVARHDAREREAAARGEDREGDEERQGPAVGEVPEGRLDERREQRRGEDDAPRRRVREAALGDEKRQQRRHGALVHVVDDVAGGEPAEGAAVCRAARHEFAQW